MLFVMMPKQTVTCRSLSGVMLFQVFVTSVQVLPSISFLILLSLLLSLFYTQKLEPGTMVPFDLFGVPWVLFRDKHGAPSCIKDSCAHRACPLSLGARMHMKGNNS